MSDDKSLIHLIDLVYQAGTASSTWDDAIRSVMNEVDASGGLLLMDSRKATDQVPILAAIGYPPSHADSYRRDFAKYNFRRDHMLQMPMGSLFVDGRDFPLSKINASPLHNEFSRSFGLGYSVCAGMQEIEGRGAVLFLQKVYGQPVFASQHVELIEALIPHLSRAILMRMQLDHARAQASGMRMTLDCLPTAVLLVDGQLRLIDANCAAEALLRRASSPLKIKNGRVLASHPNEMESLRCVIKDVVEVLRGYPIKTPKVIQMRNTDNSGVMNLLALPLPESNQVSMFVDGRILLCISDPSVGYEIDTTVLMQEHDLTQSEAQVAALLGKGASIKGITEHRKVSEETVRAQIKAIMRKTETHTQSHLASILMQGLSTLRRFHLTKWRNLDK